MKGLVELYRWPDGWTMRRPYTKEASCRGFGSVSPSFGTCGNTWLGVENDDAWLFILLNEKEERIATWFITSFDGAQGSIEDCEVRLVEGRWANSTITKRWQTFYLELLISRERVLAGDFIASVYMDNRLPMRADVLVKGLSSDEFREVQELSKLHTGLFFQGGNQAVESDEASEVATQIIDRFLMREPFKAVQPLAVPGWPQTKAGDTIVSGHHFSLLFNQFNDPNMWSLEDTEFDEKRDWEWIMVNDNDQVIGVGHTPLDALASVKQFVWPASVASDKLLNLEAWLEKWTLPGTPPSSLELYLLLGLTTPAVMVHSEFLGWAKGMESDS